MVSRVFNLYDINKIKNFHYDDFLNDLVQGKRSWSILSTDKKKFAQKRFDSLFDGEISLSLIKEYEDLIEDCNSRNIDVIGILMPLSKDFKLLTESNEQWLEGIDIFRNLDFDKILDYRSIFNENQEYFLNSDHVNVIGAEVFTKRLNNDLKNQNVNLW